MFEQEYGCYFPPQENPPSIWGKILVTFAVLFTVAMILAVCG